jgi:hypothetical protein
MLGNIILGPLKEFFDGTVIAGEFWDFLRHVFRSEDARRLS